MCVGGGGGGGGGPQLFTPYKHHRQRYDRRAVTTVLDLPILVECILNIDRRIRTARTRRPIETLTSLSSVDVAMHIVYLHRR